MLRADKEIKTANSITLGEWRAAMPREDLDTLQRLLDRCRQVLPEDSYLWQQAYALLGQSPQVADSTKRIAVIPQLCTIGMHASLLYPENTEQCAEFEGITRAFSELETRFDTAEGSYLDACNNRKMTRSVPLKGTIIITDPCYLDNTGEMNGCAEDMDIDRLPGLQGTTVYGDWSCGVFDLDNDHAEIGQFCADGGMVCVTLLEEVLKQNPGFRDFMDTHSWCVTAIPDFDGVVSIVYEPTEYEDEGEIICDLECRVEGSGNRNFTTRQTGF